MQFRPGSSEVELRDRVRAYRHISLFPNRLLSVPRGTSGTSPRLRRTCLISLDDSVISHPLHHSLSQRRFDSEFMVVSWFTTSERVWRLFAVSISATCIIAINDTSVFCMFDASVSQC